MALFAIALCGCARKPSDVPAEPGVIRFWNGFTGPDGTTMERIVKQFEKDTGLRVKMQIIPWATYYDKLTLSLAYGGAPDVFICHANRLAEFARYGVMRPIDDIIAGDPSFPIDDVMPNIRNAARYNGKLCGLPLDCHTLGLYYNEKLFREAGIVGPDGRPRPPRTLAEFLAAARRLTRDTNGDGRPEQWGFAFTWLRTNWITFIGQFGGSILTPDLSASAINQPANVEATTLMADMITRYRIAPKPEGFDSWMGFRQGRFAMALEGIYMLSSLEEQKGLEYAGAPVPLFGRKPAAWANSHIMCLPRNIAPDRAALGWRFIRYLSDHSLDWAAGGQIPARVSLLRHPRFQAMRVQREFAKELPYVVYEPASHKATEITPFYDAAIESSLLSIQTPKAALDEAHRRISQVMARP
jgi:multiple sugar transport system substrate-binding protein